MTDKLHKAAQQALEFLTNDRWGTRPYMDICVFEDAQRLVAALQEALAEPAQEPVAWMYHGIRYDGMPHDRPTLIWRPESMDLISHELGAEAIPLYAAPPEQRKPLTDEQKGLLSWLRKEAEKSDYCGYKNMATKLDAVADLLEGGAPQRKPLTNEEITEAFKESMAKRPKDASNAETSRLFVRAIEAAHGITGEST